jgi:hypothetical protein
MKEYNSKPPEQSCRTEKIASLCFCPSGDRTPYLLIRSPPLIDCATGSGQEFIHHRDSKISSQSLFKNMHYLSRQSQADEKQQLQLEETVSWTNIICDNKTI